MENLQNLQNGPRPSEDFGFENKQKLIIVNHESLRG